MVKRYSDLSRTLIKRTGVTNPNMGRIDPRPATQFFNTLSKVADQAQSTYTTLAKNKAVQDGVKDGKTFGVTFDENGVPQYNPPEVGGLFYQNAFEEAATIEYKESIQDSIAKKVDDGYRSWLDNPDNINDMEALQSSMTGGVEGILESVPDQFKNFAGSKANDRISSNLNNEFKKLASRKYNKLSDNLNVRIGNLIDEMANTTFDSPERPEITQRFEEAMQAYVKLNFGDTDLALKATREFQEAGNINGFISDIFHANEDGEYVNLKKIQAIQDVLNGSAESVTITQKNGQDLVVDRAFVLDKFNSDATRNRLIERIGKARAIANEKKLGLLTAESQLNEASRELENVLISAINNNSINDEFVKDQTKKFNDTFNSIIEEIGIDSDSENFIKLREKKNNFLHTFSKEANNELLSIENNVAEENLKIATKNILKDITNPDREIEPLKAEIGKLLKDFPKNDALIKVKSKLDEDPDIINLIRSLVPPRDSDKFNKQYLIGLKNAIASGSATGDGLPYIFDNKEYTADAINRLFSGLEDVQTQLVQQLNNEIAKFTTTVAKENTMFEMQQKFAGQINYGNFSEDNKNDFFNEVLLKSKGIDYKNLNSFIEAPDEATRKNNFDVLITAIHKHNKSFGHVPDVIESYLQTGSPNLEAFKAKVEFYSNLKKDADFVSTFKVSDYPKLEMAIALPTNDATYTSYLTNLNNLYSKSPDDFQGATNQFFVNLGMPDANESSNIQKNTYLKNLLYDEFKTGKNEIEMQNVFNDLEKGLVAMGTIATYNNQLSGGDQDVFKLIKKTFKAKLDSIVPVKDRFVINHRNKNDPNIQAISDNADLIQPNTIGYAHINQVGKIIDKLGGNSNYSGTTIAVLNILREERANITLDLEKGYDQDAITKLFNEAKVGRQNQKYGEPYIDPDQDYLDVTKVKVNATPITDNFPSNTDIDVKDFFTISDTDGSQIAMIPGKTFRLEAIQDQGVTTGYKILLIGSKTGALDANSAPYEERGYITNSQGEHFVIPLNELMTDHNKFISQSNTKQLLLEQESVQSRIRLEGDPPDVSVGTGGRSIRPFVPKFDKFTPIKIGDNTLKSKEVVNVNQQELKYINLHRMVLGTHNGILNSDGSLSTARGMIIDTTNVADTYGANARKQYHLIPSVIAYTDRHNARKYRVIQPGEQELLEEYIASVGGLDKFPVYNTLEEAQKEERKLKKIIADDYRTYKGIDQPDFSYTVSKSKGRDMVVEGVNYILNITANNNEANRRHMIATIGTESEFGENELTYKEGRVSSGIAQFDKIYTNKEGKEVVGIFDDLKRRHAKELKANSYGMAGTGLPPIFGRTVKKIEDAINRDFPDLLNGREFKLGNLNYSDLNNPLVSIAMLRLWMATQGATSTYDTPSESYWLYKNIYNTNLKLDTQKKYEKFWNE